MIVGVLLGKGFFVKDTSVEILSDALLLSKTIKTFEISALEYRYKTLIYEENSEDRIFLFIPLRPAVKRYSVQYDGAIKMGVDAKGITVEIEKQPDGKKSIITVNIPNAYIISHVAPLNDTLSVLFDESTNSEKFTIEEYAATLNDKKKETETEVIQSGLFEQAQENAKKQLDSFLRAILGVSDSYTLIFVLE